MLYIISDDNIRRSIAINEYTLSSNNPRISFYSNKVDNLADKNDKLNDNKHIEKIDYVEFSKVSISVQSISLEQIRNNHSYNIEVPQGNYDNDLLSLKVYNILDSDILKSTLSAILNYKTGYCYDKVIGDNQKQIFKRLRSKYSMTVIQAISEIIQSKDYLSSSFVCNVVFKKSNSNVSFKFYVSVMENSNML